MDWSQRKVTHAARKPPNITHSVRIAVNTGGGKGQCYSKRKKGRKIKRKREKDTKTTQNNKRGEKKGDDEKILKEDSKPKLQNT